MQARLKFLESINITQRQAALTVLAMYFLGTVLLVLIQIFTNPPDEHLNIWGGMMGVILSGGAWLLYYKRNWEPARYFAPLVTSLLVGLLLPEPFVSLYAPMVIVLPIMLALLLTNPFWMILNSLLTLGLLLARAEGKGVYANPMTLTMYAMIVGGLLVSRLIAETSLRRYKQAQERIQLQVQKLRGLRSIDTAIIDTFDTKHSLDAVLTETLSQLNVHAVAILLFNQTSQMLEYGAGIGFTSPAMEKIRLHITEGLAGSAVSEQRTVHFPDLMETNGDSPEANLLREEKFVSSYALPLIAKSELKGVLEIFHRERLYLDQEELEFLETLAGQAAIAIDNAQLFEGLQQSNNELALAYDATIAGWSRAMDLRDKETEGHTQRVTDLSLKLSRAMGISEAELTHIRRGALLHDIGKMGIPDSILLKAAELTDEEWEKMREHTNFAYEMLSSVPYLQPALDIPYAHHEKWDGTGYPRGLKGEEIPIAARIFAVADVWDAVTSDRPYRPRWSKEDALGYIRQQSGKYFDPHVVEVFLKLIT